MSERQKPTSDSYREGWERIFAPGTCDTCWGTGRLKSYYYMAGAYGSRPDVACPCCLGTGKELADG